LNVPKDKNVDSMKYFLLLIALLIFSCKSEEILIKSNSVLQLKSGNINTPIVYWGYVEREDKSMQTKNRGVMLFFFNKNKILYRIPPIECRGGLYFFTTITQNNNHVSFTPPDEIKDNYHTKYIVDKLIVLNDSTIIGSDKSVFKKLPQYTEDGYGWDAWLKSCLAKKDYYYR
jgi:hypothetical protein